MYTKEEKAEYDRKRHENPKHWKNRLDRALKWQKDPANIERVRYNKMMSARARRADPARRDIMRTQRIERRKRHKESIFNHYGNKCACCGEAQILFLSIDHINNDGNEQRQKIHPAFFYKWIINNNFPDDLQLLCMNCNFGKRMNGGICPHKTK